MDARDRGRGLMLVRQKRVGELTYLPVIAGDGPVHGREGLLVVDGVQVLSRNERNISSSLACDRANAGPGAPTAAGSVHGRVDLGRRLTRGEFSPPQCSRHVDGILRSSNLRREVRMNCEVQVRSWRSRGDVRWGRDSRVHRGVCSGVFISMLLVRCRLRDHCRGGCMGRHLGGLGIEGSTQEVTEKQASAPEVSKTRETLRTVVAVEMYAAAESSGKGYEMGVEVRAAHAAVAGGARVGLVGGRRCLCSGATAKAGREKPSSNCAALGTGAGAAIGADVWAVNDNRPRMVIQHAVVTPGPLGAAVTAMRGRHT
jgi:hypothetical protein